MKGNEKDKKDTIIHIQNPLNDLKMIHPMPSKSLKYNNINKIKEYSYNNNSNEIPHYESFIISGASVSAGKIVLYHVDIKSSNDVLATYTIRRRFTDFKILHEKLSLMMENKKNTSKLKHIKNKYKIKDKNKDKENDIKINNKITSCSNKNYPTLPVLPHTGIFTMIRRQDPKLVEKRKKIFQEILNAVSKHPIARESKPFQDFLGFDPSLLLNNGMTSYVSLKDYSAPILDSTHETVARRKIAIELKRNSLESKSSIQ